MIITVDNLRMEEAEEAAGLTRECMEDTWERWEKDYYPKEALEFDLAHHTKEDYEEHVENPMSFVIAAKENGRIVGLSLGSVADKSGLATLTWLCVDPAFRKRGIGETILKRVDDHVQRHDCHKISLVTLPCLTDAVRLYYRLGWMPEANLKRHSWKVDHMVMSKWFD